MMTHILSHLLEEYQNIVEIIEDELDNKENYPTIECIHENLF